MDILKPRSQTRSFRLLGPRPLKNPLYSVILIHPFEKGTQQGAILEKWTETSVHAQSGRVGLWVLQFSINDLLSGGPEPGFRNVVRRLREGIRELPTLHTPVIFVAHSIGAWVVKDSLASWDSKNVAIMPAGIIFVDSENVDPESFSYSAYLESFREEFLPRYPKAPFLSKCSTSNLPKLFKETDQNFGKFEERAYIQNEMRWSIKCQFLQIWFSKPPLLDTFKSRRSFRTLVTVHKYGRTYRTHLESLKQLHLDQILSSMITEHNVPTPLDSPTSPASPTFPGASMDVEHGVADFEHERRPACARDRSKPRSMKTVLAYAYSSPGLETDRRSIFSTPHFDIIDSVDSELENAFHLARSFFLSSELEIAERLFIKSKNLLEKSQSTPDGMGEIQVQAQIAAIKLYRGRYEEANNYLAWIRQRLAASRGPDKPREDIEVEIDRWFAVLSLLQGKYDIAIAELKNLLQQRNSASNPDIPIKAVDIQIRRDLAVAYANIGWHIAAQQVIEEAEEFWKDALRSAGFPLDATALSEDREQSTTLVRRSVSGTYGPEVAELHSKGHSIYFTYAKLGLLRGEYDSALEKSMHALQGARELLGRKHLKTLESASLEAILLAFTSNYSEAEKRCKEILPTMTQALGSEHPLTLDTMGCLVKIFRAQARFTEAVDTARSLYKITERALKEGHPQTLRARSQFASAYWSNGEYASAENEIHAAVKLCEQSLGPRNPDTLQYKAERARVLCLLGRVDEAKALALEVLHLQRQVYALSPEQLLATANIDSNEPDLINQTVNDIRRNKQQFMVHPLLIYTLQVLASIEMQRPESDIQMAQRTLETVMKYRVRKLGQNHDLTLKSTFELALLVRESDTDGMGIDQAFEKLDHVWEERVKLFGDQHSETLSAEREIIITKCMQGKWDYGGPAKRAHKEEELLQLERYPSIPLKAQPYEKGSSSRPNLTFEQWSDIKNVSWDILVRQERQLGPHHPETMKSYLWYFVTQLFVHMKRTTDISSTVQDILDRLRDPIVRRERLVDALRTEEKVALTLVEQGHYERAMGVLHEMLDDIHDRDMVVDLPTKTVLDLVQADVEKTLDEIRSDVREPFERLQELSQQGDQELQASDFANAEMTMIKVSDSSRRLYGSRDRRTLESQIKLASAKWGTGDDQKRREAVDIITKLQGLDEKLLGTELKQNVERLQTHGPGSFPTSI